MESKNKTGAARPWSNWLTAADERVVLKALRSLRDSIDAPPRGPTESDEKILNTLIGELRVVEENDPDRVAFDRKMKVGA